LQSHLHSSTTQHCRADAALRSRLSRGTGGNDASAHNVAVLGFVLLVGPARAADLPKEGTFTATYSSAGTGKVTPVGEERWIGSDEEHGLTVGSGLLDHMTIHCGGVADGMKNMATFRGYCVGIDPAGDQIVFEYVSDGKVDLSKPYTATATLTGGTGKYAGISGGWSIIGHSGEFKAPEGRYVQYASYKGSYKLP
jgi:hypothetical protein